MNASEFLTNIGSIAGLIGAFAWLAAWVYKKLTKPDLKGRVVSHFENAGECNSERCLMHFLSLNVISLNGNLFASFWSPLQINLLG
jgi:hypothetical protein